MASCITRLLGYIVVYTVTALGLIQCIKTGLTSSQPALTKKDKKSLAAGNSPLNRYTHKLTAKLTEYPARQRFWDLSKQPIPGFNHDFLKLRNGHQLHYIHNRHTITQLRNIIIFFHGFPDSSLMWRDLLSHRDRHQAIARDDLIVCVDLPGYGGSDSFAKYDTGVLEALAEFCIAVRAHHCGNPAKVVLVAHDWGCNLATRLATEAPCIADQFVLINGLFTNLAIANFTRHVQSLPGLLSTLSLREFRKTCTVLLRQVWCLAYVFAFDLPEGMLGYILGTWNEMAVLRALVGLANVRNSSFDFAEALAATLGPGESESQTSISTNINMPGGPKSYGGSTRARAKSPATALWNMTGLYRNGVLRGQWSKSEELLSSLWKIESEKHKQKYSEKTQLHLQANFHHEDGTAQTKFEDDIQGPLLKAPTTVIWGQKDHVMLPEICLDGLHAFLAPRSEVIVLPRSAHWVPCDTEANEVLLAVLKHHTTDNQDVQIDKKTLDDVYRGARLVSRT
ncbi:Alpha/Beta hydrolase protein [Aspergillus karnatakaensis]|uniref:alpha/beta fold hydrolase n=1 Tax=Aspergillus karnatakaensis TaxID=1810916 RepID=UPI003CCD2E9A